MLNSRIKRSELDFVDHAKNTTLTVSRHIYIIHSYDNNLSWASSAMKAANETKFGAEVAWGMRMIPEFQIHA